jgi:microcin C transport system substrate-binding protein
VRLIQIDPRHFLGLGIVTSLFIGVAPVLAEYDKPVHGFALHGVPKYGPDVKHFDYVNPHAPKGGKIILRAGSSTFDSLNPFILKGTPAAGLAGLYQHGALPGIYPVISEGLAVGSLDEPFTVYGVIAEFIEIPKDRSYVRFRLRPEALFQDGSKITVEDVIFSFDILMAEGQPLYQSYYGDVDRAEKTGDREVTFFFKVAGNTELPLILGSMPILSEAYWADKEFSEGGLVGALGSGPYRIKDFEPGRFVEYERVENYWGADLPTNVGRFNFDTVRFDYYRDETVAFEAFLAGEYDIRYENSARNWAIGYDGKDLDSGRIVKESFEDFTPVGMQGYIYNTRLPMFADERVRQALAYAFDFPWTNRTIFYDQYRRTRSYFQNSELGATGLPHGHELEILERYRDVLPPEVFTEEYNPPTTDGSGNARENLLVARAILEEAGWKQTEGGLVNENGVVLEFEILLRSPSFERITGPIIQNLERLGVKVTMRTVDASQWVNRIQAFDFDMIVFPWGQSISPGNEQREYWGSAAADQEGSRNFSGIKIPAVDEIIEQLILVESREELIAHTRALDRILQWGHYVIPNWHSADIRVSSWNKFSHPEVVPLRGIAISTWWLDVSKAVVLDAEETASAAVSPSQSEAAEAINEPAEYNAPWVIILAIVGVMLLLWNFMRRRNR